MRLYQLSQFRRAKALPTFAQRYRALRARCDFDILNALYWSI